MYLTRESQCKKYNKIQRGYLMRIYPDETVYSICSRVHALAGGASALSTMSRIFKRSSGTAHVIWKTGLRQLAEYLGKDITEILDKHSFFPYFDKFCLKEKKQRLKDTLCNGQGNVPRLLGIQKYSGSLLFLCPECACEDVRQFGEPYWHRSHQLPGSFVCYKHNIRLVNECSVCKEQLKSKPFEWSAAPTFCKNGHYLLNPVPNESKRLLCIARENDYLLNLQRNISLEEIKEKINKFARLEGYLNIGSSVVNYKKLYQDLQNEFPKNILFEIDDQIKEEKEDLWLRKVFWKTKNCSRYPPNYIILIIYLKESIQNFLGDDAELRPFGVGPWPCKNTICTQYDKEIIADTYITKPSRHIIGTFKCPECGFSYTRHTSNINFFASEENMKVQTIKETGHLWNDKFEGLLQKEGAIYIKSIAKELNVGPGFINTRLRNRITQLEGFTKSRQTDTKKLHRNKILRIVDMQPGITRTEVIRKARAAYNWLRENDNVWINEVLPEDAPTTIEQRRYKMSTIVSDNPGLSRNELKKIDITTYEWLIQNDYDWIKTILPAIRSERVFQKGIKPEVRREAYLQLRQKYPEYSKTDIINLDPNNYQWLRLNDRQWLSEHQPPPKKSINISKLSLEERRAALIDIINNNPNALRKDLSRLAGNNYTYLQRRDTDWFKKLLPELNKKEVLSKQKLSKEQRRELFLQLRSLDPEMTRSQLKLENTSNYVWLFRNDKDWLFSNSPPIRTRSDIKY